MFAVLIGLLLWGYVHSVFASKSVKDAIRKRIGERAFHAFYRAGYNIFALISIAPILWLVTRNPEDIVWELDLAWETPLNIISTIGLLGLVVSLIQIDLGRFVGITQIWAYLTDKPLPLPDPPLQTGGLYRFSRHPLYVFSLMTIWPVLTMTEAYLGWCIGTTAYFLIGSLYEEKRMVERFGAPYEAYRRRVSWMLPLPRFDNNS